MTDEILKKEWKEFFNANSKNYAEWETRVEILKDGIDTQFSSEGFPLTRFTLRPVLSRNRRDY